MFDNLTQRLNKTFRHITGSGRLTESNIKDSLDEIRKALIEADVALPVITQFISNIQDKALGQEVTTSIKPGQALVKIVYDELVFIMGEEQANLNINVKPPAVILMAGLQGSGKTTTSAKLAKWLHERDKKKVMLCSTDIYRPAAMDQLATLAKQIDTPYTGDPSNKDPLAIARDALEEANKQFMDVLIIDTAGRLHIDEAMMSEIQALHQLTNPSETLFVVDSMTGQDAANTAKAFHDALPLTGIILTKTDGDARGGAALSIRQITGKPIKFLGIGEKIDGLEAFHPDRVASRILGMGDILTLVEDAQRKVDVKKAEKFAKKIKKGKHFDFDDYLSQLQQMRNMGGMQELLTKLPGMGQLPAAAKQMVDDKMLIQREAIICSMTKKEKRFPNIINGSRKKRIAQGSGTKVQDVNRLIKEFTKMQKMMKSLKGGGMKKMMGKLAGLMPDGKPPF